MNYEYMVSGAHAEERMRARRLGWQHPYGKYRDFRAHWRSIIMHRSLKFDCD